MRLALLVLLAAGCSAAYSSPRCHTRRGGELPDPDCTPGGIETADAAAVCAAYASTHRNVTAATKRAVYAAYDEDPNGRVIDHVVPLELGGSNSVDNLWPQSARHAIAKDRVEHLLHSRVCSGAMDLREAQETIAQDWTQYVGEAQ